MQKGRWYEAKSWNKKIIYNQKILKALAKQFVKSCKILQFNYIFNIFPHSLGGETNCLRGDIPPFPPPVWNTDDTNPLKHIHLAE